MEILNLKITIGQLASNLQRLKFLYGSLSPTVCGLGKMCPYTLICLPEGVGSDLSEASWTEY